MKCLGFCGGCLFTHPELVVLSSRTSLDKGSIVSGNVSVVGVALQHVDFQFDLLLFLLCEEQMSWKQWWTSGQGQSGKGRTISSTVTWSVSRFQKITFHPPDLNSHLLLFPLIARSSNWAECRHCRPGAPVSSQDAEWSHFVPLSEGTLFLYTDMEPQLGVDKQVEAA